MKYPLLALLANGPAHGYELKRSFEARFGAVGPSVNIGQVYSTLQRLERDGLVRGRDDAGDTARQRNVYEITEAGYRVLADWLAETDATPRVRDDLFLKLILARASRLCDPMVLIDRQRQALLQELRDLNALVPQHLGEAITLLLIEGSVLRVQADLRWLDLCEETFTGGGSTDGEVTDRRADQGVSQ